MKKSGVIIGVAMAAVLTVAGIAVSSQGAKQTGSIAVGKAVESAWPEMAKISIDSAVSAALQAVPGKVIKVELEDEDGALVYGVEVAKADGAIMDVKIDAGNGKALKIEKDRNDREGHEKEESDDK